MSSTTRSHLLNTAAQLFYENSYGTTSTSKICAAASINKGTFYHFFPSKAALLTAALEQYTDMFVSALEELSAEPISAREKIARLAGICHKPNAANEGQGPIVKGCLLGNIALELSTVDEGIRRVTERAFSRITESLTTLVTLYAREQEIDLPVQHTAELLLGTMQGSMLLAKARNNPSLLANLGPALIALVESTQQSTSAVH